MGNPGWSWDEVLPVFKRSENYQHGADAWHGEQGEMRVEERRVNWKILDAWREAAAQCGIPKITEFNRGDNFGNAYFQMNQQRGRRQNAVRAFLQPAMRRPNLTVLTEAHVHCIDFADPATTPPRAVGVTAQTQSGRHSFQAKREVLLAAGAIGSPQLLQLSGVGDGELLRGLEIPTRCALPGVGENLQDHLQIRSVYKVRGAVTLNQRYHSPISRVAMALEYMFFRRGPLTMPPSQLGAFARSDPALAAPDLEWHVQPLSLDRFGEPLHKYNAITPSVCNLRPSSRGHVRITTPDPQDHPAITLNYLSTAHDRQVAVKGLRFTRRIMRAEALAPFAPEELKPGPAVATDADLAAAAGDLGTTIFHPVGTCKMGNTAKDPMAVVDARLSVHGARGLRVIDASIMPRITSGNTNAPTVMIAEQGAEFVLADARS